MDTKHQKNKIKKNVMLLLILFQLISAKGSMVQAKEVEETKKSWNLFNLAPVTLLKSNVAQPLSSEANIESQTWDISGIQGESVRATLEDGILKIEGHGPMKSWSDSENTPWFNWKESIRKIEIQEGITYIGNMAFYYLENITYVNIPKSVKGVGSRAFDTCTNLTNIVIPSSVTSIGDEAFKSCRKLGNIVIPSSVTTMGKRIFSSTSNLTLTIITDTSTSAAYNYAVSGNIKDEVCDLWDISENQDESVIATLVGDGNGNLKILGTGKMRNWLDFKETPWGNDTTRTTIRNVKIEEGVTHIGGQAFANGVNIEKITIPRTVTSIGNSAFFNCLKLTSIEIPNNVASIGASAFEACTKITNIHIPNSVTTIGRNAFLGMKALTGINVSNLNENYSSYDGVLFDKNRRNLICYPSGKRGKLYRIPKGVVEIDYDAFYICDLETLIIPDSVTKIKDTVWSRRISYSSKLRKLCKKICK